MAEYIDREALIQKIVNTPFTVNCSGESEFKQRRKPEVTYKGVTKCRKF